MDKKEDRVNSPKHYRMNSTGIEVIDIIETFKLNFCRGNVIKYVLRAGRKSEGGISAIEKEIEDLQKGRYYLDREIENLKMKVSDYDENVERTSKPTV